MFRTMQGLCWTFSWYTHFPCSFTKHTLSYLFVSNDPSHYFLSSSLMEGAHKLYINDGNNNACCTEWLYEHWTLWDEVQKIILPFSFYRKPVTTNAMIIFKRIYRHKEIPYLRDFCTPLNLTCISIWCSKFNPNLKLT